MLEKHLGLQFGPLAQHGERLWPLSAPIWNPVKTDGVELQCGT
jgi:hypothetical protein